MKKIIKYINRLDNKRKITNNSRTRSALMRKMHYKMPSLDSYFTDYKKRLTRTLLFLPAASPGCFHHSQHTSSFLADSRPPVAVRTVSGSGKVALDLLQSVVSSCYGLQVVILRSPILFSLSHSETDVARAAVFYAYSIHFFRSLTFEICIKQKIKNKDNLHSNLQTVMTQHWTIGQM